MTKKVRKKPNLNQGIRENLFILTKYIAVYITAFITDSLWSDNLQYRKWYLGHSFSVWKISHKSIICILGTYIR